MNKPDPVDYIKLPIDEACSLKFEWGQQEHGPVFLLDPLVEANQETIDILNYMDEAEKRGYDKRELDHIRSLTKDVCLLIRQLWASK